MKSIDKNYTLKTAISYHENLLRHITTKRKTLESQLGTLYSEVWTVQWRIADGEALPTDEETAIRLTDEIAETYLDKEIYVVSEHETRNQVNCLRKELEELEASPTC